MKKDISLFFKKLRHLRTARQTGLLLCEIIKLFGIAGITLTIYVFADYFLALSPLKLKIINIVLIATAVLYFLIRVAAVFRISFAETAAYTDKISGNRRHSLLGTLELLKNRKKDRDISGMREFLLQKLLDKANGLLVTLGWSDVFPKHQLKKNMLTLVLQGIIVILMLGIPYQITNVVLNRIFHPSEDIPPYSRYIFRIAPEKPSVIYGGTLELSSEITGAPIHKTVLLRIKQGGTVNSTACFKDGGTRYVQRIEKLTSPVEFCFAVGRSRSRWHKVELLMLPRISLARIDITPPEYTHIPNKHFVLGRSSLNLLKNSDVSLTVTSNRPLSGGDMVIIDRNRNRKVIQAEKSGIHSLKFKWKAKGKSDISVTIRDIRGTEAEKPLKFKQLMIADRLPEVELTEPDSFFLATPDAKFKVKGYADDDFGLKRVDFVRNVIGYRDRMKHLGPDLVSKSYNFSQKFDFAEIGVQPGEIIEIYAEASDFNPSLMGVAASDVIKIKIISKDEYAEILRTRSKVETVFRRYSAMRNAFRKLKKSLQEFRNKIKKGNLTESEKKKELQKVKTANKKANDLLAKLAEDFPIYEMEKEQKKVFKSLYNQTMDNESILDEMTPADTKQSLILKTETMLAAFKQQEQKLEKMNKQMKQLQSLVNLMKTAGRFAAMLQEQEVIVRRLTRFKLGNDSGNSGMLKRLGEQEKKMADELKKLKKQIIDSANALPPEYKQLREDSLAFTDKLESYDIIPELIKSHKSAVVQRGNNAFLHGEKALEMMRRLINKKTTAENMFCKMCRGEMPKNCSGSGSGMYQTAREMLQAILRRSCKNGRGRGDGYGRGESGRGGEGEGNLNDGYSMGKSSMLDLPVVGPGRSSIGNRNSGRNGRRGEGKGSNSGNRKISEDAKESLSSREQIETETESISLDDAPYKYRKAVKEYFSSEEK